MNIAGTGPVLGPIQGVLFGPIAFLTIPIGNVIGGAVHDYLCGMIMMRDGGSQSPEMIRKYTNDVVQKIYLVFVTVVLILIGAVFVYTPGDILATQVFGLDGAATSVSTWVIYGAIFVYYFIIDKIIGRVYPVFGAILLVSAVGVFVGMFVTGAAGNLIEIWESWNVSAFVYGEYFSSGHYLPVMFITIACGSLSGFHSTQVAIVTRTVESERQGKTVFYRTMDDGGGLYCHVLGRWCHVHLQHGPAGGGCFHRHFHGGSYLQDPARFCRWGDRPAGRHLSTTQTQPRPTRACKIPPPLSVEVIQAQQLA